LARIRLREADELSESEIVRGKLTLREVRGLARPHKTLRDAVHGDVKLNHLEVSVIDTPIFQRLRRHKQLGLSDRVYSSAEHSRFQHAIGTLFVAILMLDIVSRNRELYRKPRPFEVNDYGALITRLAALIHDIVNIPFGHTIEDEGLLIPRDWKDAKRVKAVFDDEGEGSLFEAVVDAVVRAGTKPRQGNDDQDEEEEEESAQSIEQLEAKRLPAREKARTILTDVKAILTYDETKDKEFEFAYATDIVGNTFCSDLLDYLERDAYFTGTQSRFRTDRSRAISYLFIPAEGPGKGRLVIRLWHHNRFKDDVVSEIFNVLRARKDLAAEVYFHHAKVCLSAMLIAAIQRSKLVEKVNRKEFLEMSDQDLINRLKSDDDEVVRSLGLAIDRRRLYKPVYLVSKLTSLREQAGTKFKKIVEEMRSEDGATRRAEYENKLVLRCRLNQGDVIIHCPDTEMNPKAAKARVLWEEDSAEGIEILDKVPDADTKTRIQTLLEEHENLWKFHVFVNKRVKKENRALLAAACRDLFGRDNEIKSYRSGQTAVELSIDLWASKANAPPDDVQWVSKVLQGKQTVVATRTNITSLIDKIQKGKLLPSAEHLEKILALRGATQTQSKL
jgi:uncharacterized protein